jgi:iron complex transport system permease protein
LVAPHIARRLLGVDWRATFPAATLIGMVTMLVADLIAQRGINWFGGNLVTEVNVGIIAALIGAPSLLILMRKAG